MNTKLVIFDMDGTILDTLSDLTDSTNFVLNYFSFPPKSSEQVRSYIGNGISKLIELAIPNGLNNPQYHTTLNLFKNYYEKNMFNSSKPYPDIIPLLMKLKSFNIKTAVVSNKFDIAVKKLTKFYFNNLFDCAAGENEAMNIKKKPAPDMVFQILNTFDIKPSDALFVGDSIIDIQTALNSSLKSVSVSWGYSSKEFLLKNGASAIADTPFDILKFL